MPPEHVDVIMIAPKGPGHTVRSQYVEGHGVPSLRTNRRGETPRGDLGVTMLVQTPTKLDAEQRELLAQLARLRGEAGPEVLTKPEEKGFFNRLKDVFS